MERGVGEHDAEFAESGRERAGKGIGSGEREQDNGRGGALKGAGFGRADGAEFADGGEVAHHDGEGFAAAAFGDAKAFDGGGGKGVAGELVAAETFDGEGAALLERGADGGQVEREAGAADGAGGGLGMEAAIGGIGVFMSAIGAEREAAHGGVGAVVGGREGDGVAGAAVGAIGEGIGEAAIGGIADLGEARGAGGEVGGDEGETAIARGALDNVEAVFGRRLGKLFEGAVFDARCGRGFVLEQSEEAVRGGGVGDMDFDDETAGGIEGAAGEAEAIGEALDEGAEADALDYSCEGDPVVRGSSCAGRASCARRAWLSAMPSGMPINV